MTTLTLSSSQCTCPTCRDTTGRTAVIADLIDQCSCDAESICSACHALGTLTDRRRCQSCREWSDAGLMNQAGHGKQICDGCWERARNDWEGYWDGSDR